MNPDAVATGSTALIATRGSLWGNFTSFDMSKLVTRLEVRYLESCEIECVMHVNTAMQAITSWNRKHWTLEMDTFAHWLLIGDELEEEWREYRKACLKSDSLCVLTLGVYGILSQPEASNPSDEREPNR